MASRLQRSDSRESVFSISSCISGIGSWQVGDRARANSRSGTISFIGLTKFAPGEWIGLTLDEPFGKNDGAVGGHRYFTCTPEHGLFIKSSKLERIIMSPARFKSPTPGIPDEPSKYAGEFGFDLGDRVTYGGKSGTLRFLEKAEFAPGIWAGIELDQPNGKNDGSVQGKRYFTCKPMYGVFAPAEKTQRSATQLPPKMTVHHNKSSLLRQSIRHGGSGESLNSIGRESIASSRFGLIRPGGGRPTMGYKTGGTDATIKALQGALHEKETHLTQMMAERDMQRNEMADLINRCEQLERSAADGSGNANVVANLQAEVKRLTEKFSKQREELLAKRKEVDDLQFRIEEEKVLREVEVEELQEKVTQQTTAAAPTTVIQEKTIEVVREDTTKIDELSKQIEALKISEQSLKTLANENETKLQEEINRLTTLMKQMTGSEDSKLTALAAEMEKMRADLGDTVAELDTTREALLTEKNAVSAAQSTFEEMKKAFEKELDSLSEAKASRDNDVTEMESRISKLESELSTEKNEAAAAKAEANKFRGECDSFRNSVEEKDKMISALTADQGSIVATLQERINALEAEKLTLNDLQKKTAAEKEALAKTVSEKEHHSSALEKSLNTTKAELHLTEEKLAAKSGAMTAYETEITDLRTKLEKMTHDSKENAMKAKADIESMTERLSSLHSNLEIMETEKARVMAEAALLQENVITLSEEKIDLESKCSVSFGEAEKMKIQLEELRTGTSTKQNEWDKERGEMISKQKKTTEELNSLLKESSEKVDSLTAKLSTLTADIQESKAALEDSNKKFSDTEANYKKHLVELKATSAEHKELQSQIEQLKTEAISSEDTLVELKKSLANSENTRKEGEDAIVKLKSELELKTSDAVAATSRCESLQSELRSAQDSFSSLQSTIESAKLGEDSLAKELAAARTEAATKQAEVERLGGKNIELESTTSSQKEELEILEKNLLENGNQLKAVQEEMEEAVRKLERSLASETTQRSKIESDLRKKTDEASSLQIRIDDLLSGSSDKDGAVTSLNAKLSETEAQLQKIQKELTNSSTELDTIRTEKVFAENELAKLAGTVDEMKAQLSSGSETLQSVQAELEEMKKKAEDVGEKLEQTTNEKTNAELALSAQKEECEKISKELTDLQAVLANKTAETEEVGAKGSVLEAELSSLRSQLADTLSQLGATKETSSKFEQKSESLETKSTELSAEVTSLKEKIEEITRNRDSERDALTAELYSIQAKYAQELQAADEEKCQLKKEITLNVEDLEKLKSTNIETSKKAEEAAIASQSLETLTAQLNTLKSEAVIEKESSTAKILALESELLNQKSQHNEEVKEADEMTKTAEAAIESLTSQLAALNAQLTGGSEAEKVTSQLLEAANQKVEELTNRVAKSEAVASKVDELQSTISSLQKELDSEKASRTEAAGVQSAQMASEFAEAMDKVRRLADEKAVAENETTEIRRTLEKKEEKIAQLESNDQGGSAELRQKLELLTELETSLNKKNIQMVERIDDLETQLDAARRKTQNEENRDLQNQVNFLHSIIADQGIKEKQLKAQVQLLLHPTDDVDDPSPAKKEIKIRLFCDICDEFDLHDTEDCPTQAMEMAETARHSHYSPDGKKVKPPPRTYCDHCEEFGHETTDCEKQASKKKKKEYTF